MLTLEPETEKLLRRRARARGKSPDALIRELLAEVPASEGGAAADIDAMRAIARRVGSLPLLDRRSEKEITDEGWGL